MRKLLYGAVMPNKELAQYIKQQLKAGTDKDSIHQALVVRGWEEKQVNKYIRKYSRGIFFRIIRIGLFVFAGIILFVGILFVLFDIIGRYNDKPLNDADVTTLHIINIPDAENAYVDLQKIDSVYNSFSFTQLQQNENAVVTLTQDKNWYQDEKQNDLSAQQLMSVPQNAQVLQYFATAMSKQYFQNPALSNPATMTIQEIDDPQNNLTTAYLFDAARLNALHALLLADQNQESAAMDMLLSAIQLGERIQNSQNTVIGYLGGRTVIDISLQTMKIIVTNSNLSSDQLKQYAQQLTTIHNFDTALKVEYVFAKQEVNDVAIINQFRKNLPVLLRWLSYNSYFFQPNNTAALFAQETRITMQGNNTCTTPQQNYIQSIRLSMPPNTYNLENVIGKAFFVISDVVINTSPECAENAELEENQLFLLVKAYQKQTGKAPTSLQDLIPEYITTIPINPLTNSPISSAAVQSLQ